MIAVALLAASTFARAGLPDFPIAVWCQDPANADRFKAAGINLYVALWKGPTEEQLAKLTEAGMPVVCDQNRIGLNHKADPIIAGWMHGDEPDNAQELPDKKGYGPPVPAARIEADYRRIKAADPSRPVIVNLGQGVAWDGWYGRGVRTNHPEDYAGYAKGCDIASFDIYPVVHDSPDVKGKLWYVPFGVERLRGWAGAKPVWACIEASRISDTVYSPTPAQVRFEVWSAIISGARGLVYFVHQFEPRFVEASLLENRELLPAVTALNREVTDLAPVILGEEIKEGASVASSGKDDVFRVMCRRHGGADYIFVASWNPRLVTATVTLKSAPAGESAVEVVGESRSVRLDGVLLQDDFPAYSTHIYRFRR